VHFGRVGSVVINLLVKPAGDLHIRQCGDVDLLEEVGEGCSIVYKVDRRPLRYFVMTL
jgi:hypothetical protein